MKFFRTILTHEDPESPSGGDSMTQQQYKKDCDMNTILKQYKVTGQLPTKAVPPSFGDFTNVDSYEKVFAMVESAKAQFAALPSEVRDRFGNDPKAYCKFVLDPANVDECIKLGLREVHKPELTEKDYLRTIAEKVTATAAG